MIDERWKNEEVYYHALVLSDFFIFGEFILKHKRGVTFNESNDFVFLNDFIEEGGVCLSKN